MSEFGRKSLQVPLVPRYERYGIRRRAYGNYLVDVLQRVGLHPASQVEELTPRVWKTQFANNFLTSDLAL